MITTSIRDLRALANHFNGLQTSSTATPTTQTPPHLPLPRSVSTGHGPVTVDVQPDTHHHHRSVVADVPYLQGVHNHKPVEPAAKTVAQSSQEHPRSNLRDLLIETVHKKVVGRLLIVGDVHGCPDQLRSLMRVLQYDRQIDLLIIAGDLVNKGPDSHGAVRAAMELGAKCVLGNHDATVLELCMQIQAGELDPFSRKTSRDPAVRVAREMTDDCVQYLQRMPHVIKVPQYNLMVLHAGINLSFSLEEQSIRDLTHLRRLEWNDERQRYDSIAKGSHGNLWAKMYGGPETIVFGHDARSGLQDEAFAIGLDTGCCYGGSLTAVVFPGRKFVSVPGLPKENRLRADEDFDETASRLDTPAVRDPSPPPSFYDPVSLSNRSTPYSATLPNGAEAAFPMAPAVQQLFQKHRTQQGHAAAGSGELQAQQQADSRLPPPSSFSQQSSDPISYLQAMASPETQTQQRTRTPPLVTSASPNVVTVPTNADTSNSVQIATLQTLVQGQHARAILALLRTELYRSAWNALLEGGMDDSDSSQGHTLLATNGPAFWSSMVEMIIAFTDREKTLTDDTLELVDLLLEILGDKREMISPKAIARIRAFSGRLESGELKGLTKGVLKAIQTLLK